MDLLKGYGSLSDSERSEEEEEASCVRHPQTNMAGAALLATTAKQQPAAPAASASIYDNSSSNNVQQNNKRGKKILSLASVLPAHILEALTKGNQSSSSSDDSDEEGKPAAAKRPKQRTPKAAAARTTNAAISRTLDTDDSAEISSFLADLRRAVPEHAASSGSVAVITESTTTKPTAISASARSSSTSSRMGAAFLQSTTTTTTTVNANAVVRDIHGAAPAVDTGDDYYDDEATKEEFAADTTPELPRPSSTFARPMVRAAPSTLYERHSFAAAAPTQYQQQQQRPGPDYLAAATAHNETVSAPPPQQKKRSRKEMERALRRGEVESVLDDAGLTSLQGADPNAYAPDASQYTAAASAANPTEGSHTVRNVTTQMYDATVGATVAGKVAGKGKNQINQLLAQAAVLERERAQQQPTSGASNTSQVKLHRANAKRKYGW